MKKRKNIKVFLSFLVILLSGGGIAFSGISDDLFAPFDDILSSKNEIVAESENEERDTLPNTSSIEAPDYDGTTKVIELNENQPLFSEEDLSLSNGSWQKLSDLDDLNRVGQADALLSKSMMPKEEREKLYVQPTGYRQTKTKDGWLYNRAHIIGHQLTGENNNLKNLFTGTEFMNQKLMVNYENEVAQYLRTTRNHVRYRVTPKFLGSELVCRGVQMEARSIEDSTISFNVYIYNVQDGYSIDYLTGSATKEQ